MKRPSARDLGRIMVAAAAGCLVGASVTAWLLPDVDDSAIRHATESMRVTAAVELRSPNAMSPLQAVVTPPLTETAHLRDGGFVSVITADPPKVGETIRAGDVIAEISGRPVLAFPRAVPLYRDLSVGDKGNDVKQLETILAERGLLGEQPDSRATERTRKAVNELLSEAGHAELPEGLVLKLADTVVIPDGAKVMAAAEVGDQLDAEHPLATIETRGSVVTARADVLSAAFLEPGSPVTLTNVRGTAAEAKVESKSAFQEATSDHPAGYDVVIAPPEGLDLEVGGAVVVSVAATGEPQPAVPLSALRHEGAQTYVLAVPDAGQTTQPNRVDVVVGSQSDGFAILRDSSLPEGTLVVLRT